MRTVQLFLLLQPVFAIAQEPAALPRLHEQQLENQAERDETITEDDTYWQQLHDWQKHPLNLNEAGEDELNMLQLLTGLQISNFLKYRNLLGRLIDKYELQAIPGWDLATIQRLLPYITVNDNRLWENLGNRFKKGAQKLLLRWSNIPERSKGYIKTNGSSIYVGSPLSMLVRYTYKFKNLLQYGITAEKDAGEQFFRGAQSKGFDFYSIHFFARKLGNIKALALGDFSVKVGQGLIQWQGHGFKKGAGVLFIKRQGPVLQPYNSAGEFNFYRGGGITLQKKQIELTVFASVRKLSANLNADSSISSILSSGYHRTLSEIANRNNIQLISTGSALQWHTAKAHLGLNTVYHHFSHPLQPNDEPYDLFAASGNQYLNYSIDYGYTFRNMHVFGEVAADRLLNTAQLHGLLTSLDPKIDMALLYRSISFRYQSLFSNAFTENSLPVNEKGWYAGISIRPAHGIQLDMYADVFRFPWLKFQINTPSNGQEYLVQLTCTPNKNVEVYTRFRHEIKPAKAVDTGMVVRPMESTPRKNWRTQITYTINRTMMLRSRIEAVWHGKKDRQETGFLFFQDIQYKPAFSAWSFSSRLQYIETGGYDSRIYAFENQVLYNMTIPAFFDKGVRYMINATFRIKKRRPGQQTDCMLAAAFAQTIHPVKTTIGSGNDAIEGRKRSEIKLQMIVGLR